MRFSNRLRSMPSADSPPRCDGDLERFDARCYTCSERSRSPFWSASPSCCRRALSLPRNAVRILSRTKPSSPTGAARRRPAVSVRVAKPSSRLPRHLRRTTARYLALRSVSLRWWIFSWVNKAPTSQKRIPWHTRRRLTRFCVRFSFDPRTLTPVVCHATARLVFRPFAWINENNLPFIL